MDNLFDSLTEDWISEPRSSHSISVRNDSPVPSNSSQHNVSQSKIPRYSYRSASSIGASNLTSSKRRSSGPIHNDSKNALSEKTSSYINASHSPVKGRSKLNNSPALRPSNKRNSSASSSLPALQDTVQHKPSRPSPAKGSNVQATPDWKRRVIQGNVAPGDQCDLFSPTGLENVFRPPTVKTKARPQRSAKTDSPKVEAIPSSPPLYSAVGKEMPAAKVRDSGRRQDQKPLQSTKSSKKQTHNDTQSPFHKQNVSEIEPQEVIGSKNISDITKSSNPARSSQSCYSAQHSVQKESLGLNSRPTERKDTVSLDAVMDNNKAGSVVSSSRSEESRNSSDQGQDRAEFISPLYVSRHHTIDGHVDYAALDMSQNHIRIQIDKARLQQRSIPSSPLSNDRVGHLEMKSSPDPIVPDLDNHEWTSHSLPDDLSMGTDAFVANGGFINTRRGGYSDDGSFQRRALTPSSLPAFDASDLKSSVSAESTVHRGPGDMPSRMTLANDPAPTTPKRNNAGDSGSQKQAGSSGSPLKLFDKYDTFTNDRLSRRISKFEENISQISNDKTGEADKKIRKSRSQRPESFERRAQQKTGRISSFGEGMLDSHKFSSYQPSKSDLKPGRDEETNGSRRNDQLEHDVLNFDREPSLDLLHQSRSGEVLLNNRSRSPSQKSKPAPRQLQGNISPSEDARVIQALGEEGQADDLRNALGKRLPRSPVKDPQPKRRRTLRNSEELQNGDQLNLQEKSRLLSATSMIGRKRKDALYDGQSQAADPEILATRTILLPRTSTSTQINYQDRKSGGDNPVEAKVEGMKTLDGLGLTQDQHNMESPTKALAEELATFTLNMTQDIANGSRKASVTTADFFNEAEQIMQLIRAQARPQSSRRSFEEVEAQNQKSWEDSFVEESTKDEFSRPPSREGASLRRTREYAQVDARVMSHLKRFEEKDDFELTLSSSLKSLQVKQNGSLSHSSSNQIVGIDEDGIESDPPNLRIVESQIRQERRKLSLVEKTSSLVSNNQIQSVASQSTSNPSTGRSLNTGSSRGSKNKAVIAPESVSHLLSDQVAGMKYNQEKQAWVKLGVPRRGNSIHVATSEMTEDLLAEIPDLSVDELEEMQRIKDATSSLKSMGSSSKGISNYDYGGKIRKNQPSDNEIHDFRPQTAESATTAPQEDSSAPSKYSRFTSSGPIPETRATSWGDNMLHGNSTKEATHYTQTQCSYEGYEDRDEEVEHEISILEGRLSRTPTRLDRKECQPRVVTVAFSSPLIDQTRTPNQPDFGPEMWQDESNLDLDDSPIHFDCQPSASSAKRRSASFARVPNYRSASRRASIGNQSFICRPMSRLDEQDEIAFLQCSDRARNAGMDIVVSTPLPAQGMMVPNPPSTSFQSSVGFHLSPLADFTMHQTDKSISGIRDVTRRCGLMPRHEVEDRFSLATQSLVKQLTDLEPYEPYWDFIRSMNLQDRGLVTLHMLDEFCGRTEVLDVSNNSLGQLDGAPSTIRDLKIRCNHLTDLTAWGHLYNLQYLDISCNLIQSLKGFQALVHLRELKADDNQIESLDGIHELDGLISLSLRGNCVSSVDFEATNL